MKEGGGEGRAEWGVCGGTIAAIWAFRDVPSASPVDAGTVSGAPGSLDFTASALCGTGHLAHLLLVTCRAGPAIKGSIQVPAWPASSDVPVASPLARRSKSPPSLCACQRPRGSIVMAGCGNVPVGKLSGGLIRIKLASPGGGPSCYKPEPRCPLSCGAANFRLS